MTDWDTCEACGTKLARLTEQQVRDHFLVHGVQHAYAVDLLRWR